VTDSEWRKEGRTAEERFCPEQATESATMLMLVCLFAARHCLMPACFVLVCDGECRQGCEGHVRMQRTVDSVNARGACEGSR